MENQQYTNGVHVSEQTTGFDPDTWDAFVQAQNGHLLQTSRWGRLKAAFGWTYQIIALGPGGERLDTAEADRPVGGALMLFRSLPFGIGTMAYVPRGPVVDWQSDDLPTMLEALINIAKMHNAIFLKIEPDERDSERLREQLVGLNFRESVQTVQPPNTILIDIGGTEDNILARMNQGTRRKIRQTAKKGVEIRRGTANDLESFNRLTGLTGTRNEFGVHSPEYYRTVYDLFAEIGSVALLMASYEGQDIAGIMVFALGDTAWYFYGASSDVERQRMPNYGLQWDAIRWAREQGCTCYDLWGVPDADEATLEANFQNRSDGLWGVYGFKRGFGGQVMRTVGAWDRVFKPVFYAAYRWIAKRRSREQAA
jgi:peptidoglycan pentaglycine glycine transferase (the first glycine)